MNASGFNIVSLFHESAARFPERMAIADKNGQISFAQLQKRIINCAEHFQKKGLKPGDRVLVFVPMSIDLYVQVLALYHIGCTAVFLDEWVSIKRLTVCCEIAKCRGFIGIPLARFIGFFVGAIRAIPLHFKSDTSRFDKALTAKMSNPLVIDSNSETALITFTTGSTGTPKAAKRTHDFLRAQFDALIEKIQPAADDVDMPVLPIILMINLGCGIPSVIANWKSGKPEKMNPDIIWQQINTYGVNRITSSPYFLKRIAESANSKKADTGFMRKLFTGGAPVYPKDAAIITRGFGHARFEIVYGSTEAEPISAIDGNTLSQQLSLMDDGGLLVGKPYHRCEVKIIIWKDESIACSNSDQLNQLELPQGQIGEIIVHGDHVLREYFNNDEALKRNKIMWDDICWHRTGDSGFLNDKGELLLTGRAANLFVHEGKLVAPFIYEYELQQIEGVEIGTLLQLKKEIHYFIELKSGANRQNVEMAIKAMWPAPDKVHVLDKMPRDKRHHSKIEYGVLRIMRA
ncbi:MAG: AMP-binding protein [Flavobacteriales bacterium]